MFSIKHVADDGSETIMAVVSSSFDSKQNELTGYDSPGPDNAFRKDGIVRLNSGLAYIMNELGRTVGIYNLRK